MADNKPKSKDEKREDVAPQTNNASLAEGANRDLQDRRGNVFGDNTSSSGAANNPGQHGRDGGEVNGEPNNPAPTEEVISGDRADDMQTSDKEMVKEEAPIKKL